MGLESAQLKSVVIGPLSAATNAEALWTVPNDATIASVKIASVAGIAANDTDYFQLAVTNYGAAGSGSTVLAELDTRAAHENALVAKVAEAANLNTTATNLRVAAGDVVSVKGTKGGSATGDYSVTIAYRTR